MFVDTIHIGLNLFCHALETTPTFNNEIWITVLNMRMKTQQVFKLNDFKLSLSRTQFQIW